MFSRRRKSRQNPLESAQVAENTVINSSVLPRRSATFYDLSQSFTNQTVNGQSLRADEKLPPSATAERVQGVALQHRNAKPSVESFIFVASAAVLPILTAVLIVGILTFATGGFIKGASGYLIHLRGSDSSNNTGLWLGLSGYCVDAACSGAPLNTFYSSAYDATEIGSLRSVLPLNYSQQASLLLACLVFLLAATLLYLWACFEARTAEVWEHQQRKRWVREWLTARRLDFMGCAFALAGLACGIAATTSLTASASAACAAVNTLAPTIDDSDYTSCEKGTVVTVLLIALASAAVTTFFQLVLLAQDGLSRKLRLQYEAMVFDLDAFAKDDFVVLQNSLNRMTDLRNQMQVAPPENREAMRQILEGYIYAQEVPSRLRRQEQLLMAQRFEFETISSQCRMPFGASFAQYPQQASAYNAASMMPRR